MWPFKTKTIPTGDTSRGSIRNETQPSDDCNYTVEYQFSGGFWTHTRTVERDYAKQCLAYFAALDAWQRANGYSGLDGDAEFRKVWSAL